jgi:hypothetical protein
MKMKVPNGIKSEYQVPDYILKCPIPTTRGDNKKEWASIRIPNGKHVPVFAFAIVEGKPANKQPVVGYRQACVAAVASILHRRSLGERSPYVFFGTVDQDVIQLHLMHLSEDATITKRVIPDLQFNLDTLTGCAQFLLFSELLKELANGIANTVGQHCDEFLGNPPPPPPPTWWYVKSARTSRTSIAPAPILPYAIPATSQYMNISTSHLSAELREGGWEGFAEGSIHRESGPRFCQIVTCTLRWVLKKKKKVFSAIRRSCGQQSQV